MQPVNTDMLEILLVEDEKFHQIMARKFLDKGDFHYRLHTAVDGEEALDFLHRRGGRVNSPRPDLILLDLGLPKINGSDVFDRIKKDPDLKQIPVIVLTGADLDQLPRDFAAVPGSYCFTKWMEMKNFMALIKTVQAYRATFSKKAA